MPHLDFEKYKGFENKCLLIAYTVTTRARLAKH